MELHIVNSRPWLIIALLSLLVACSGSGGSDPVAMEDPPPPEEPEPPDPPDPPEEPDPDDEPDSIDLLVMATEELAPQGAVNCGNLMGRDAPREAFDECMEDAFLMYQPF